MTSLYLNVKNTLHERREAGQGTIEYLGIAVVIAIVILALTAAFSGEDGFANDITTEIGDIISNISGEWGGE